MLTIYLANEVDCRWTRCENCVGCSPGEGRPDAIELAYTSALSFAHQENADWLIEFHGQLKNCLGKLCPDPWLELADVYSRGIRRRAGG